MSRFDAAAPTYDAHRGLPGRVVEAIRAAVLDALAAISHPRLLDPILADMAVVHGQKNPREHVQRWLGSTAGGGAPVAAATWDAERTPRGFLERHRTGARFSLLPEPIKDEALSRLAAWALTEF